MNETGSNLKDNGVLLKRVVTSVIAIPIIGLVVWFGTPWVTILAAGWGMGSVHEFYGLVKRDRGVAPLTYFGMLWVLLMIISPHFDQVPRLAGVSFTSLLITGAIIIPLLFILWRKGKENAFANWTWTVAGILYIGWLLSYMVALRDVSDGRGWVFMAILCTFASDSTAYFAGKLLGRHKLAPYISPKKTWEGAVGGALGAVIVGVIVAYFFDLPIAIWQAVLLGLLISVFGQLGDLVKSLFKRNMEVKDSGNVLPGHGGFLDRMDSLAFAGVTVYLFVAFITPGV